MAIEDSGSGRLEVFTEAIEMTRRTERPMMTEEREAIRKLSKGGMTPAAIATALFLSKRQVKFTLAHPDNDTEAAISRHLLPVHTCGQDTERG